MLDHLFELPEEQKITLFIAYKQLILCLFKPKYRVCTDICIRITASYAEREDHRAERKTREKIFQYIYF